MIEKKPYHCSRCNARFKLAHHRTLRCPNCGETFGIEAEKGAADLLREIE